MTSSHPGPSVPTPTAAEVLVVGAGIAGIACARALRENGVSVRIVDRGRRPGGRMSGRTLHGRVVDLGASYFTVPDGSGFSAVVGEWERNGLARPWTDRFAVLDAGVVEHGRARRNGTEQTTGPLRYAAAQGLRSLVIDLAAGLDEEGELERDITSVTEDGSVDGVHYDAVVLAMPEPQAARVLAPASPLRARLDLDAWEPVIAVALGFSERSWPADLHGAFVNGSPTSTFLADDGDRRGDGAPIIVAHSTAEFARDHLAHPETAVDAVEAEVRTLLDIDPRSRTPWSHAHRWTFARATTTHPESFALDGRVGICGDAWGGRSSVSTAWASGDALGRAIARGR